MIKLTSNAINFQGLERDSKILRLPAGTSGQNATARTKRNVEREPGVAR